MNCFKNHILQLYNQPFECIKRKTKTIEMRLYDEKRQRINVGDTIIFLKREDNSQKIVARVKDLHKFSNFAELYKCFDKISLGYDKDETANPEDMEFYYSKDDICKYGVIGIEIEVV